MLLKIESRLHDVIDEPIKNGKPINAHDKISFTLELYKDKSGDLATRFADPQKVSDPNLQISLKADTIITFYLYQAGGDVDWEFRHQDGVKLGKQYDKIQHYQNLSAYPGAGRFTQIKFEAICRLGKKRKTDKYNLHFIVYNKPGETKKAKGTFYTLDIDPDIKNPGNIGVLTPPVKKK